MYSTRASPAPARMISGQHRDAWRHFQNHVRFDTFGVGWPFPYGQGMAKPAKTFLATGTHGDMIFCTT
ncbi:hypothetical protein I7I50_07394 [Histoplasma capsulatum G186AR]|uniref:Uncharacterized protein n=1 Tax=Ajellomyces capsulatus TaxID=5037 RepID=A0A8H7Z178_AJECA|nr:hypothetical protein I7I52_09534 [Histoplasma capsulatum]QSS68102.1 hypothetical protein I7I50_07394 [Histoplasma capsulatum G186AR]